MSDTKGNRIWTSQWRHTQWNVYIATYKNWGNLHKQWSSIAGICLPRPLCPPSLSISLSPFQINWKRRNKKLKDFTLMNWKNDPSLKWNNTRIPCNPSSSPTELLYRSRINATRHTVTRKYPEVPEQYQEKRIGMEASRFLTLNYW